MPFTRPRMPQPDRTLVEQIDWARLAAYIDGEGWIGIAAQVHKNPAVGKSRYDYAKLTITNTNPRLMQWLVARFGGNVQTRAPHKIANRWKPCFVWIMGSAHAGEVLQYCLPYFIVKREQAELAIAFQSTMRRSGRSGTPADVLDYREAIKSQIHVLNARGPRSAAVNE